MKTKLRPKHPWHHIFSILLIASHVDLRLCRPPPDHVDDRIVLQNDTALDDPHAQVRLNDRVRPIHDLDATEPLSVNDGSPKDYDTLYSPKDFIDFLSAVDVIGSDDASTRGDAGLYVISDREDHSRNLVRKRRQPEDPRPHRRRQPEDHRPHRRRKHHRLVFKARDEGRNHVVDGKGDGFKDRHVIKSDSPGYVITSASEVKKDWCKTIPLRHKVAETNCRSRVVQNNFCYGQCNSFFIPHTSRTDTKMAFQSCAVCKPVRQHWGNVTLNCPGNNPPKVIKTVLFVDECRCVSELMK